MIFIENQLTNSNIEGKFILSWISIQQKLALARQIVAELRQTHAHER